MSGFVQRLVGRAMGLTKSVHSAARLPYAPPPALVEPEWPEAVLPNSVPGDGQSADARRVSSRDPMRRSNTQDGRPSGLALEAQASDNPLISPERSEKAPEPPEVAYVPRPRDDLAEPPEIEVRQPARVMHGELPEFVVESDPESTPRGSHKGADSGSVERRDQVSFREIAEPLLPPQRVMHPPLWGVGDRPPDSSRGSASASRAEETTEVHVTIGRIEVTAVHEAPPPKHRSPPPAKPMTLEEYLARRRGERP